MLSACQTGLDIRGFFSLPPTRHTPVSAFFLLVILHHCDARRRHKSLRDHYPVACVKHKMIVHARYVIHVHYVAAVAPQKSAARQFPLYLAQTFAHSLAPAVGQMDYAFAVKTLYICYAAERQLFIRAPVLRFF